MTIVRVYLRALQALHVVRTRAILLAAANVLVAAILLAEPILFGRVVDAIAAGRVPTPELTLWAALGLGGVAAGAAISLGADRLAHRLRLAAMTDAFERAISQPPTTIAEAGSGKVTRIMLAGADSLFWTLLGFFREHISAVAQILLLFPAAFFMQPSLALLLAGLAVFYAAINVGVVARTEREQQAVEGRNQALFGRIGDVVGNVTVVQSFQGAREERAGLGRIASELLAAQLPVLTWWAVLSVSSRAAATFALVSILAMGAWLSRQGVITVGEIVSFTAFAGLLIARLDQVAGALGRLFVNAPTLSAFFDLIDRASPAADSPGARPLGPVKGEIQFEAVSFRFPGAMLGVRDVSFTVPEGRTVALVGRTGAGKSTVLTLLQRLREPQSGRILIDGVDIAGATAASVRAATAMVFQDAGLFNRSIRENLRLARADATDEEMAHALKLAEAADFVARKPGGLDFVIGERGGFLSGGERQRLAIARAILKDAPILLLDEATSALDPETERRVQRALDAARAGRTTLIIAHRLSTIAKADEILVFDEGAIVERGTYAELLAAGGLFAELAGGGEPGRLDEKPSSGGA